MRIHSAESFETWVRESVRERVLEKEVRLRPEYQKAFPWIYPLYLRIKRFCETYLILLEKDFSSEAALQARSAIEHAVTLQWILLKDDGIERFQRKAQHDHRSFYKDLGNWLDINEIRDYVAGLPELGTGDKLPRFSQIIKEFDSKYFLEVCYRILSQYVHVTHVAVESFVNRSSNPLTFKDEPNFNFRLPTSYAVASSMMLAKWAMAVMKGDENELLALDRLSEELRIPVTLSKAKLDK